MNALHPPWSLIPLAVTFFSVLSSGVNATETPHTYDRIQLEVSAERKVVNDEWIAILFHRVEGPSSEALAKEVNQTINRSVEMVRNIPEVSVQTLEYRTHPTYSNQQVTGWSVQQSIRLESKSAERLASLIAQLQKNLKVESINDSVSSEARRTTEEALVREAIHSFQQRAELVTRELGRSHYRLVNLDVDTGHSSIHPLRGQVRAMALSNSDDVPSPTLEAGHQTVTVTLRGMIELQAD